VEIKVKYFIFVFFFYFLSFSKEAGPIIVGGGGGTSEFYLILGAQRYVPLLETCLATRSCSEGSSSTLQALIANSNQTQMKFKFLTNQEMGQNLVVRIENFHYQVNKDLMFVQKDGLKKTWQYTDAVQFIFGLLKKEIPIAAQLEANLIKLASSFETRSSYINRDGRLYILARLGAPLNSLVIETTSVYEISFLNHLDCYNSSGTHQPLNDLKIDAAYWISPASSSYGKRLIVKGQISYECLGVLYKSAYQANLELEKGEIDPTRTEVIQSRIEVKN
jgi:hypothetical protein